MSTVTIKNTAITKKSTSKKEGHLTVTHRRASGVSRYDDNADGAGQNFKDCAGDLLQGPASVSAEHFFTGQSMLGDAQHHVTLTIKGAQFNAIVQNCHSVAETEVIVNTIDNSELSKALKDSIINENQQEIIKAIRGLGSVGVIWNNVTVRWPGKIEDY